MNYVNLINITGVAPFSLLVAACSEASDNAASPAVTYAAAEPQAMTNDNHEGHDMADMKSGDIDHGAGKVVEVDVAGRRIKLDHEELPNIGMNAMTMFFGIAGDVNLAAFEAGDNVRFMVKKGRDGSYRIMAMCNAANDGEGCLSALMDHSER